MCGLKTLVASIRSFTHVVAESPALRAVLLRTRDFAEADAPTMIFGESGTGKEVVARVLHANSARRRHPFVALNVAALPGELLESELFGHVRGAFTGAVAARKGLLEAADGGMLFLDEIAEMPLGLQAKLLRVVQDGEVRKLGDTRVFGVDVRFVCATHRDLEAHVARGLFREDLYYRLKVLALRVPPLRDRREDILPLVTSLLAREKRSASGLTAKAREALLAYRWPGNVRELGNAVQHGCALARGGPIRLEHLPEELQPGAEKARDAVGLRSLADVEREHILHVLDLCGGSQPEAAAHLRIGRTTLWRKLRNYGVGGERATGPASRPVTGGAVITPK